MKKYAVEYIQEIKPEYISETKVYIYELNINYFNIIENLKQNYKLKNDIYKIDSLKKIPLNIKKFYDEYGFYIYENKIYSVVPISDLTIESIRDSVKEKIIDFIDRESENIENLDLNIESLFEDMQVNKTEKYLSDLKYLQDENEYLFNNILKSKLTLNICSKSFNIPYLIEDVNGDIIKKGKSGQKDKVYSKVNKELQFMPIYGKNGEMFTKEFIEAKKEKAILKLKADIIKEDKLFFKYTMIFSELIKNPVEYRDLFSTAWKDYSEFINGKIPRKQRTFYLKKDNGFVPIKLRRVYTLDYSRLESHEDLKFTYEYEDSVLSSKIEDVFGYTLKDINKMLQTEGTEDKIFLQNWSQADRPKPFKGSGLTYHDKYYISEHIKNVNSNLGDFKKYKRCSIKDSRKAFELGLSKSTSTATKDNGVVFEKTMLRNPNVRDINFYIFKNSEEEYSIDIVECVKSMFFSPEDTIKANSNYEILKKIEKYKLIKNEIKNTDSNNKKMDKLIGKLEALKVKIEKDINTQINNISKEKNKIIKSSKSIKDTVYIFNIIDKNGNDREINIHLNIVDTNEALEQYIKGETVENRIKTIEYAVGGKFKENSVALIELEDLGKVNDAKAIIRQALNSVGVINQFINPIKFEDNNYDNLSNDVIVGYDFDRDVCKYEHFEYLQDKQTQEYSNKVRKSVLELLVDFGLTDASFSLNENTVYSFGILDLSNYNKLNFIRSINDDLDEEDIVNEKKENFLIDKDGIYIPIISRMTDETIEVKILLDNEHDEFDKWEHVSKLPYLLNKLKQYSKEISFIEKANLNKKIKLSDIFLKISDFINNEDDLNKIVLLSNVNCNKLEHGNYKNIFVKNLNKASILFLEPEDTHYSIINPEQSDDKLIAFSQPSNFLYKVSENIFKAVGQKPIGIKATEHGYSRMIPLTKFKSRKLFKIEVLSNTTNLDNEQLAYLIHRIRTSLTTSVQLNLDILTEYIYSSLKKVFIK